MHFNYYQVMDVITDYIHDHWTKLATAGLFMALGWLFGKRRARAEWKKREFYNRINISLNAIREGTLRIRTIAERHCADVFLNSVATDFIMNAARATTAQNPIIALPEHDYWFYLNAVLNEISEKFGEGQIRRDMGLQVAAATYVICLTSESAGEVRTRKIRAMLIQKELLEKLPEKEPKYESPNHATRWETLKFLAKEFQANPNKFRAVEICI
jgi:hypothetical protein